MIIDLMKQSANETKQVAIHLFDVEIAKRSVLIAIEGSPIHANPIPLNYSWGEH